VPTIKMKDTEFWASKKDVCIYWKNDPNTHCTYSFGIKGKDGVWRWYKGSSVNVHARPYYHARMLSGNKHENKKFQTAFNKRDKREKLVFKYGKTLTKSKNKSYTLCDLEQMEIDNLVKTKGRGSFLGRTTKVARVKK